MPPSKNDTFLKTQLTPTHLSKNPTRLPLKIEALLSRSLNPSLISVPINELDVNQKAFLLSGCYRGLRTIFMLFFVWLRMQWDHVQQDLMTFTFFTLESKIVSIPSPETEQWSFFCQSESHADCEAVPKSAFLNIDNCISDIHRREF